MKRLPLVVFSLFVMAADTFAQTSAGDKILGVWLSENKDGKIEVYKSDNKISGVILAYRYLEGQVSGREYHKTNFKK